MEILDTRVLISWLGNDKRLSRNLRKLIESTNNDIAVSSVSALEITTKFRFGKLPSVALDVNNIAHEIEQAGFRELPLTTAHATRAGLLPHVHRDSFDRLLAAQALLDAFTIASIDEIFDEMQVTRIA